MLPRQVAPILGWIAVVLVSVFFWLRDYDAFQFGTWVDDSHYTLLARSIVRGEDYALHFGPVGRPSGYPFLYPLLLAPFVAGAPEHLDAGKAISLVATVLNTALLFWGWNLLSGLRSRWWALTAAALYAFSPHIAGMTHMVMSEPLFTTFILLATMASERCAREKVPTWSAHALLGLATAGAFYTRSAGVAVVAAVLVRLVWRRGRHSLQPLAAFASGVALLAAPVVGFTSVEVVNLIPFRYLSRLPLPYDQREAPEPLLQELVDSVKNYTTFSIRYAIVPVGGGQGEQRVGESLGVPDLPVIVGLAVTALVLIGAVWSAGGALFPTALLIQVLYAPIVLSWHYRGPRLILPVLPFASLQFLWGIQWVIQAVFGRRAARAAIAVVAAVVFVLVAGGLSHIAPHAPPSLRFVRDFREGTAWLREHAEPGALVLAEDPLTIHLYTGRPVVPMPLGGTADELWQLVRQYDIRYMLVAPEREWNADGRRYNDYTASVVLPMAEAGAEEGKMDLVYASPPAEKVRVYRIHP